MKQTFGNYKNVILQSANHQYIGDKNWQIFNKKSIVEIERYKNNKLYNWKYFQDF